MFLKKDLHAQNPVVDMKVNNSIKVLEFLDDTGLMRLDREMGPTSTVRK